VTKLPDAEQLCVQLADSIRPQLTPNTAMIAKLTHSITSTLPCRNFVQTTCTTVAAIATAVASRTGICLVSAR